MECVLRTADTAQKAHALTGLRTREHSRDASKYRTTDFLGTSALRSRVGSLMTLTHTYINLIFFAVAPWCRVAVG